MKSCCVRFWDLGSTRGGQLPQRLLCLSVGRIQLVLHACYGIDFLVERLRVLSPVKHRPLGRRPIPALSLNLYLRAAPRIKERHYRRIRRQRRFRVWLLHDWCPNADCSLLDNRSILLTGSRAAGARCVAYVWLHGAREGKKAKACRSSPAFVLLAGLAR